MTWTNILKISSGKSLVPALTTILKQQLTYSINRKLGPLILANNPPFRPQNAQTFKQCALIQVLAIAVVPLTTSSRTSPKTRPWTDTVNIRQAIHKVIHLISLHIQIINGFKLLKNFSYLVNPQNLVITFTNSNTAPSQTRHTTNQNIRGISVTNSPRTKTNSDQACKNKCFWRDRIKWPWIFWGRGGGWPNQPHRGATKNE